MAKFPSSQLRPFLYLGIVLAAWLVVPTFFKNVLRDTLHEFQAPIWMVTSYARDLQTTIALRTRSRTELAEAVRDLSRENARYREEFRKMRELESYTQRLENLLDLPSRPDFRYEVARVVRRDQGAWWQSLIIRKGADYGIPEGAAVVFDGGVVGRIRRVFAYTAEVELLSSPTFRMAAQFEDDRRPVTYQGWPNHAFTAPNGRVFNAPADINPNPGRPARLVSSSLGGVFPSGLPIGSVHRLSSGRDGLFQTGPVQLDERLLVLQEVAVLIPLTASEQAEVLDPTDA